MHYSKEEQQEFDRIFKVFGDYLKESPNVDVVPSKAGYVVIPINDGRMSCEISAEAVETPADLCELCMFEMAQDIRDDIVPSHTPLYECSEETRREILNRLSPYMETLPEYRCLEGKLFVNPLEAC